MPEHYRTHVHVCHIKVTKSDCLSDTVHFKHKRITNTEVTHADKVMKAIASLASILKCKPSLVHKNQEEIREPQQLMSSNPSFVKNDTRQEVERTSGRALKLSKNSYEKTSESHNNLFEKTSESQELSPSCRQHVGDMSATHHNVSLFPIDTHVDRTQKSPRHTQFISITADKFKSAQTYQLL